MKIEDVTMKEVEVDNNFNCRREEIVPSDVTDLMADIKQDKLLQPVIVRPSKNPKFKYSLVAGFRRFAACKFLGWETIPAIIDSSIDDDRAYQINLSENIQRKNLTILQEAYGVNQLFIFGHNVQWIADRLDKGRDWVNVRLLLLQLPQDIQAEAASGLLNARNIKDVWKVFEKDPEKAYKLVLDLKDKKLRSERKDYTKVVDKENQPPQVRRVRNFSEIFDIQDVILDAVGTNIASRALAWVTMNISTREFLEDFQAEAKMLGFDWAIPIIYNEPVFANDKVAE